MSQPLAIKTPAEAVNYIKNTISIAFTGQKISYTDSEVEIQKLGYTEKVQYKDIEAIRVWMGHSPYGGRSGAVYVFIFIDVHGFEKPIEVKYRVKRKFFTNHYEPIDTTMVEKIKEKNPEVKIDEPLTLYMQTHDLAVLWETNKIYDKQVKPALQLGILLAICILLYGIIMVILKLVSSY
jgi:hypothetical protein